MSFFNKIERELREYSRIFLDRQTQIAGGVSLAIILLLILARIFHPSIYPSVFYEVTFGILGTLLAVYFSLERIIPYIKSLEKDRIASTEKIVNFYKNHKVSTNFLKMSDVESYPSTKSDFDLRTLPIIPELLPDKTTPLRNFEYEITDEYYDFPENIETLYEPVIQDLKDQFSREGHFNQIKVKLDSANENELRFKKTPYFRNFVTNLSPDYDLFEEVTLRELIHNELFDEEGNLKSLSESPLSNGFGARGLVITREGKTAIPIRR